MANRHSFIVNGNELTVHGVYHDPRTAHRAEKVIADGKRVMYLSGGKMYSTGVTCTLSYGTRWERHTDVIRAAMAFGLLPKEDLEKVIEKEEAERKRRYKGSAAVDCLSNAVNAGVRLPPQVRAALRRVARAGGCMPRKPC